MTETYVLDISATDGGGRVAYTKVKVTLDDTNDNAPVFSLPQYHANIPVHTELGYSILKVLSARVSCQHTSAHGAWILHIKGTLCQSITPTYQLVHTKLGYSILKVLPAC